MPSPSEQLSQDAYRDARAAVTDEVASNLSANVGDLVAGGVIPMPPPAPDWTALANEAINNRTLGGIPLSQLPPDRQGRRPEALIPTAQRAESIARDVSASVAENTGSMEMLQGATIGQALSGFFSMIQEKGFGAALMAVFNLIFGDGNSQDAKDLKGFIAQNTSTAIGNDVTGRLRAHQSENGLTEEQIQRVGITAQNKVRERAGMALLPVPGAPSGSAPAVSGPALNIGDQVRATMRSAVVTSLTDEKFSEMAQGMGLTTLAPEQRSAITEGMTDALQHVATTLPPGTDGTTVRNAIQAQLATRADAMGMGGMAPPEREAMLKVMANELTLNYLEKRPRDRAAYDQFKPIAERENTEAKQTLIRGRVRPAVMQGLGLQENPPGTFVAVSGPDGAAPQIQTLEMLKVGTFDDAQRNTQRGVLVSTLSEGLENAAANRTTDPVAIRDDLKRRLESKATEMGFGGLSPEDRNRLFTVMANESTANYLSKAVSPEAATQFMAGPGANTEQLKSELMSGRIRATIITSLGMTENPPGTFVNANPQPADAAILQLEQAKGEKLDNTQRTAVVNSLTTSLQHVAEQKPPMSITDTQAYIQSQLSNPETVRAMGFEHLSADEKTHLFRRMANEATSNYARTANVGTPAERAAFEATASAQNNESKTALAPGAVRRTLTNMLDPTDRPGRDPQETQAARDALGMLTMATGGGQFNRDAFINALTPALTDIATRDPRPNPNDPAQLGVVSLQIENAIRNANPPTGIPLDEVAEPGKKTKLQQVAETMAKKALSTGTPSAATPTPGTQLVGAQWEGMMNQFRSQDAQLHETLGKAINLDTVRDNVATALDNVIRTNPDFHTKSAEERRALLRTAINQSLQNGAIPDGKEVEVGSDAGGLAIAPDRARSALADLMADKMTGVNNPPRSYMPLPGTPGVRLTGALAPVETVANVTGLQPHLQNLDVGQIQGIATDIGNGNIGSGLNRAADGVVSVWNYWTR